MVWIESGDGMKMRARLIFMGIETVNLRPRVNKIVGGTARNPNLGIVRGVSCDS